MSVGVIRRKYLPDPGLCLLSLDVKPLILKSISPVISISIELKIVEN